MSQPSQQAERFKLIKDFYSSNLDTINKGLYGRTDKVAAMKALEARFIGSNFFDTLNIFRERALEPKQFAIQGGDTPKSNTEISADKISSWLKINYLVELFMLLLLRIFTASQHQLRLSVIDIIRSTGIPLEESQK